MRKISFDVEKDGFYGFYWKNKKPSKAAIIAMLGDDASDYLAKRCVKWMQKQGLNVLTMSPAKKDYSHHNYPLERIERAVRWPLNNENEKMAIAGASTTGTLALAAASRFPEITLTIAFTPSDFMWQGFTQGKKDGCGEWPVEGESLFIYLGKPLPFMPFCYKHPEYWRVYKEESRKNGDAMNSRKIFDDSEKAHPIREEEFIKIENIEGKLVLIGAEDDSLWDTSRYIKRSEKRLSERPHPSEATFLVYEHGTHFVFPESLFESLLPGFSEIALKAMFRAGREHPKECKRTREDIDRRVVETIRGWKGA